MDAFERTTDDDKRRERKHFRENEWKLISSNNSKHFSSSFAYRADVFSFQNSIPIGWWIYAWRRIKIDSFLNGNRKQCLHLSAAPITLLWRVLYTVDYSATCLFQSRAELGSFVIDIRSFSPSKFFSLLVRLLGNIYHVTSTHGDVTSSYNDDISMSSDCTFHTIAIKKSLISARVRRRLTN